VVGDNQPIGSPVDGQDGCGAPGGEAWPVERVGVGRIAIGRP
jgi:hypothetical protein